MSFLAWIALVGGVLLVMALSVVALSVVVHGVTSPLLDLYEKAVARAKARQTARAARTALSASQRLNF